MTSSRGNVVAVWCEDLKRWECRILILIDGRGVVNFLGGFMGSVVIGESGWSVRWNWYWQVEVINCVDDG